MDTRRVGIVGVGNMGGALAARLLELGWSVQVCDLDAAKTRALEVLGAVVRTTPVQCAQNCSALMVCVVDSLQIEAVLFGPGGAADGMAAGQAVLLCPTIAPEDAERFATRLLQRGIAAIDAPMSGGPVRARDGTMSLMLACADDVFQQQRPLIEALSSKVFRVSERPGDGARTKLVNNLLAGINLVAAAEVLALAERLGLAAGPTLSVIEQSSGQSWIGSDRMRRAIAGDLEPRAHMRLLAKDTRLALQAAAAAGFEGPLGEAAAAVFAKACAAGLDGRDDAAMLQWLRGPAPTIAG
ncbi:MAG: NAD(P)-dependent oxidoreductase [Ramlibacter sp.]|nr:NAD(P)-dependent oxidoreductase [Ramlibacter sp.]